MPLVNELFQKWCGLRAVTMLNTICRNKSIHPSFIIARNGISLKWRIKDYPQGTNDRESFIVRVELRIAFSLRHNMKQLVSSTRMHEQSCIRAAASSEINTLLLENYQLSA